MAETLPGARRILIEYEDDSTLEVTGDDAEAWVAWIDQGVALATSRGYDGPDIIYDEAPGWHPAGSSADRNNRT